MAQSRNAVEGQSGQADSLQTDDGEILTLPNLLTDTLSSSYRWFETSRLELGPAFAPRTSSMSLHPVVVDDCHMITITIGHDNRKIRFEKEDARTTHELPEGKRWIERG